MNLANLAIKRPIFVTCIVIIMVTLGFMQLKRMPVDLFPDVNFPYVMVMTPYPGAGPAEVETQISKVLEDEISNLAGIKSLSSQNREGVSIVSAEFTLETDVKNAEQQIRDRVSSAKRKLPKDIDEPIIRRLDPADQPIVIVSVSADLAESKLYDLINDDVKYRLEQVSQVGKVDIIGVRKREIRVELDRAKLKSYEVSATQIAARIGAAGMNIPAGKINEGKIETVFRTLGEFKSIKDVSNTIVNFIGNDVPVTVSDVGKVVDTLQDETSRGYVNGRKSAFLMVYRQSGANTIGVSDAIAARIKKMDEDLKSSPGAPKIQVVRDTSKMIRANVADVRESIMIGISLTVVVVFFFLGSLRSTFITGLALPNSLIGAFILMSAAGFTINVMSLLALSLSVGLLIDDAIVVRENIFRHLQKSGDAIASALEGTKEVTLAVVATTLTVVAVFGSIGFLPGIVGQFFRQFGLTVCFALFISLFDAMTMAPMLSAYFAGRTHGRKKKEKGLYALTLGAAVKSFERFQDRLEVAYEKTIRYSLVNRKKVIGISVVIFVVSLGAFGKLPKSFMQAQDFGEFMISLELPPGTSLNATQEAAEKVDKILSANKEFKQSVLFIGGTGVSAESNKASFFIEMIPSKERAINTTQFKERLRSQLKDLAFAKPLVKDIDMISAGMRPFMLYILGSDLNEIEKHANAFYGKFKNHPALLDPEITYTPGKPEFQVVLDNLKAEKMGVSTSVVGAELRAQIEGVTPVVYREAGREYDIRIRMKEEQRNLREGFNDIYVPNINFTQVKLSSVAQGASATGPSSIDRQNKSRYIQFAADIAPKGPGMAKLMADIDDYFTTEGKLPPGMRYKLVGQAENFKELASGMIIATVWGLLFIFVVLASLYESFVTPFSIMLVLPLAASGAFISLYLFGMTMDMFCMIGCIMLLGIATKNSILLVDYTNQLVAQGLDYSAALVKAGKTRLRPILMTTGALVAGMLPIAIGLNEASKQRTSMGIAVIGGLVTSTLLSLIVVPATYSYIETFREWSKRTLNRLIGEETRGGKKN